MKVRTDYHGAPTADAAVIPFRLHSDHTPAGDQPQAIAALTAGVREGRRHQTLLGVTGSGKTFTMANLIQAVQKPTLVLSHNKTLAAQLYAEFRALFPDNAVEYFISYYDYYQPEAYVPSSDLFIEKDSSINESIDRLRHRATRTLFERSDVIIVASVSCIYGLGSPEAYHGMLVFLEEGREIDRDAIMRRLVEIQYERNQIDFHRGTFRAVGDVLEIFPASEDAAAVRIEFFGDTIDRILRIDPLRGAVLDRLERIPIYPASHYVTPLEQRQRAIEGIREELRERLRFFREHNRLVEAQRLETRTLHDMEMLEELGYCPGVENYSRHLTGRRPGEPPPCLLDYFPRDFLCFLDESHVTVPQLGAMYRGDRSRKETLVEYGFRLPSALDNRPLNFTEWEAIPKHCLYVSATPGPYELQTSGGVTAEQILRPTGIVDPPVEIRPVAQQVDDLLEAIRRTTAKGLRTLVTTLTKRMAEDLTDHYRDLGLKVAYLHSEIGALDRIQVIRDLRQGKSDVLIGINLLREGLDLPEVGLVAVLDADKEGFLRGETALIQTLGRAARNVEGRVILYADRETSAIRRTLAECRRRREKQLRHNEQLGIVPRTVRARSEALLDDLCLPAEESISLDALEAIHPALDLRDLPSAIRDLRRKMKEAAAAMEFEEAARLRDRIRLLESAELELR